MATLLIQSQRKIALPVILGELGIATWLLWKGGKVPKN